MSMIGIHYHCIRHMTMFMNSSNFKLSTVILTQVVSFFRGFFPRSQSMDGELNIKSYRQTNRQAEKREKRLFEAPDIILL